MANAYRDQNNVPTLIAASSSDGFTPVRVYADPTTHRLLVDIAGGGSGTVTDVSVVTANGFAGSVATSTTTPAITLSTTVTGLVKGNGTAISAASAGTDYVAPGAITTSGLTMATSKMLGRATAGTGAIEEIAVTGSGSAVLATSPTLVTPVLGAATATSINGLTITSSTGTLTITNAKTASFSNSLTFAGTDSTTMTFPTTSATLARTDAGNTFTGSSTASAWVLTSPTITTKISPTSDDGAPLGDTTHNFSDLFLATGAVVNYQNGNVVLTHSSGVLTLGTGTLKITTPTNNTTSVLTTDGTQTLSNKRNTRRTATSNAPGATPTTNTDNVDVQIFTGLNTAITSMTTNLSGTPVNNDLLEFKFLDDGTGRAITWGSSFASGGLVTLPTTTVASTVLRVLFEYQTEASLNKWVCIATA